MLHAPATRFLRQRPVRNNMSHDAYRTDFHRNRIFRDPKAAYAITLTPQDSHEGEGGAGGGKEKKDFKGAEEKVQMLKQLKDITVRDSRVSASTTSTTSTASVLRPWCQRVAHVVRTWC